MFLIFSYQFLNLPAFGVFFYTSHNYHKAATSSIHDFTAFCKLQKLENKPYPKSNVRSSLRWLPQIFLPVVSWNGVSCTQSFMLVICTSKERENQQIIWDCCSEILTGKPIAMIWRYALLILWSLSLKLLPLSVLRCLRGAPLAQ